MSVIACCTASATSRRSRTWRSLTSLWVDPERGLFVAILTNRVHPRGVSERHVRLRRDVADAVQQAVTDMPVVELRP